MKCPNCTQHNLVTLPDDLYSCQECGYFEKGDEAYTPTDRRPAATSDPMDTGKPYPEPTPKPETEKPVKDDPQDEPFLKIEPFGLEDI